MPRYVARHVDPVLEQVLRPGRLPHGHLERPDAREHRCEPRTGRRPDLLRLRLPPGHGHRQPCQDASRTPRRSSAARSAPAARCATGTARPASRECSSCHADKVDGTHGFNAAQHTADFGTDAMAGTWTMALMPTVNVRRRAPERAARLQLRVCQLPRCQTRYRARQGVVRAGEREGVRRLPSDTEGHSHGRLGQEVRDRRMPHGRRSRAARHDRDARGPRGGRQREGRRPRWAWLLGVTGCGGRRLPAHAVSHDRPHPRAQSQDRRVRSLPDAGYRQDDLRHVRAVPCKRRLPRGRSKRWWLGRDLQRVPRRRSAGEPLDRGKRSLQRGARAASGAAVLRFGHLQLRGPQGRASTRWMPTVRSGPARTPPSPYGCAGPSLPHAVLHRGGPLELLPGQRLRDLPWPEHRSASVPTRARSCGSRAARRTISTPD